MDSAVISRIRARLGKTGAWLIGAMAVLGLPGLAQASNTDCVPEIVEVSPLMTTAGNNVTFDVRAGGGTIDGSCSFMNYVINTISDTTAGSSAAPSPSSASFNTTQTTTVSVPAAPSGGGEVTFEVVCNLGCEISAGSYTNPTITVQLADFYSVFVDSGDNQSSPSNVQFSQPLTVYVERNGAPATGVGVNWTPLTGGISLSTASTVTNGLAVTQITATPTSGSSMVHMVQASVASDPSANTTFNNLAEDNVGNVLSLTSGFPSTALVGDSFPLLVTAYSGGVPVSTAEQIDWFFHSSLSECTDASGPGVLSTASNLTSASNGQASNTLDFTQADQGCLEVVWMDGSPPGSEPRIELLFVDVESNYLIQASGGIQLSQTVSPATPVNLSVDLLQHDGSGFVSIGSGEFVSFDVIAAPDSNWNFDGGSSGLGTVVGTDISGAAGVVFNASTVGAYTVQAVYSGPAAKASNGAFPVDLSFTVQIQNQIVTVDDDFTGTPINGRSGAVTASVHGNDSYNSSTFDPSQTTTTIADPAGLAGLSVNSMTGVLNVGPLNPAGDYPVIYEVCDNAEPTNCQQATATLRLTAAPIVADSEDFSGTPFRSVEGGSTASVFVGDTIDGTGFTDTDVIASISSDGGLTGVSIDSTGAIVLPSSPVPVGNFNVVYQICEALNPGNCTTATATVAVINNPPAFGQTNYAFAIDENAAAATAVGTASATDADSGVGDVLTYSISAGDPGGAFSIDSAGNISVANPSLLDFEVTPSFSLTVLVEDAASPASSDSSTVDISVNDLNEAPSLVDQVRNVVENSSGGTPVGAPLLASDGDAGANGMLSWSIVSGNTGSAFQIDSLSGQLSVLTPAAVSLSNSPFSLGIQVTDGGTPSGLSASATVTVTIDDVNDAPVFTQSTYSASIDEGTANGSLVSTVVATDVDAGQTVSYAITAGDPSGKFSIDPSTGSITVANGSLIDFEVGSFVSLTVQATDDAANPLTATANVDITINDINEAPSILDQARSVTENAAAGTSLGVPLLASDVDAGANGVLSWSITAGNTANAFQIDASTGQLTVLTPAAVDPVNSPFALTVQVTDGGTPSPLSASATVTVTVGDVNDAPVFGQSTYAFAVNEAEANGTLVGGVVATDADVGQTLTYAITAGDPSGKFAINPATGDITVANGALIDFEAGSLVSLTVQATDNDASPLSGTASVDITINDINEAPSILDQSRSVAENASAGTLLGSPLLASDVDAGANGALSWAILSGNAASAFQIDSSTGQLSVLTPAAVDPANSPFSLVVQVTDGGTPSGLSASATVTVTVGDVNDAPVFSQSTYAFAIDELAANGTAVGSISATDVDVGQTLSYAITAGDPAGRFSIDPVTGAIVVANGSLIDFEAGSLVSLTVQATDNDASPLSATATVDISLNDVNEAPSIQAQSRAIIELAALGTNVGAPLSATDVDAGSNGSLSWSILSGNTGGAFSVNPTTGQLTVSTSAAVVPANSPFNLVVQVQDGGSLQAAATVTVAVNGLARTLTNVSGEGQSARAGESLASPLIVRVDNDGVPVAGVSVEFMVSPPGAASLSPGTAVSGADGLVTVNVQLSATATGSLTVTARRNDDPSVSTSFGVLVAAPSVKTLQVVSGDGQSGNVGATLNPLSVRALDDGVAAAAVLVNWSVSGPATLSAPQSTTNADGTASVEVTLGANAGSVVVTASRADAPTATAGFALTALEPVQPILMVSSGDGQQGVVNSRADRPIVVTLLREGGAPAVNSEISWQVISGAATLDADRTMTDENGVASIGFNFATDPGSVQIAARSSEFGLQVITQHQATASAIGGTTGGGQGGLPGQPLGEDFIVTITQGSAKGLAGIPVEWAVLAGGGSLETDVSLTDENGKARNRLTLGPVGGTNTVQAKLPDGRTVLFSAEAAAAAAQLSIVSGNGQTVPTNDPSAPLIVALEDAAGNPIVGATILWTADSNASVDPESSVTDAEGRAQTIARVLAPGAAQVSADTDEFTVDTAVFALNGGVANIPGLSDEEEGVSNAVDGLCPALAALPSRTAEEEDLFQRCSELVDNAGDNPDEVRSALGELPPDVGSTINDSGQDGLDAQFDNINTRFLMLHDEQRGGRRNQFNIGLWTPTGMLPLSTLSAVGEDGEAESADPAQEVGIDFDRWGFFATGTIGRGEADATSRRPKFDYDIVGLTAGVDYRFSDSLIGGVALGLTDNDVEIANSGGTLDTRGWSTTGYLSWFSQRAWYVDGAITYGSNDYDLSRGISYSIRALDGSRTTVDQVARASTSGTQLGTSLSLGRDWQKGAWNINSYLRGTHRRIEYDGYQERMISGLPGQGLALIVDGRSTISLTTALGGKATYVLSRDWGILMPTASIEWEHEYRGDASRTVSRFAFDPTATPIIQEGDEVDTNYFNVGIGVSALFPGGKSAFLYYEELVGAANLRQGILSIGGRIEF